MATDSVINNGGEMAELSEELKIDLEKFLPSCWSRGNPIDILGDADVERYDKTIRACIFAKNVNEAAMAASRVGFPVVLKVVSPDIVHKMDIGGVIIGEKKERDRSQPTNFGTRQKAWYFSILCPGTVLLA